MQAISYACVIFAFIMRLPIVLNKWESNHQRILQVLGLESVVINSRENYLWLSICHRFILALAIMISETFFVCNQINIVKPNYIASNEEPGSITQE